MKRPAIVIRPALLAMLALPLLSCGFLSPKPASMTSFYVLDGAATADIRPKRPLDTRQPILLVSPPQAAAGFDGARMAYLREPHKLEYFAHSEWISSPAHMLAPMIVTAITGGGGFAAVVPTPSAASGDLTLDIEILRLQQEFMSSPSRVRFTLRATMVDNVTGQVLASRELDQTAEAATDDPYGGVVAADVAVQAALVQLAEFCNRAASGWTASSTLRTRPAHP